MDRTQELVGLIKEHWVAHIETKKKYLMLHYMDMKPEFCKKLNYLIDGQRNREKGLYVWKSMNCLNYGKYCLMMIGN